MEKKINIKKWLLYTYVMLATMLLGTSCVMDNDDLPDCPPPTPKPNEEAPAVKAGLYCNDNLIAWEEGKSIGVYLIDNEAEKLLNDSLGAPYRINKVSTGLFLPQWGVGNQVIKRPALGVVRDALGIYPYGIALENTQTLSLSVADQTDQDKLDLFIPRRVKGITATTDTIRLDFHRRMSRLLFNLTLTEVKADQTEVEADDKLAGATILVNGLPIDGTFQLADEQLETGEATSFQAYTAANGKQGQAIVFPGPPTKDIRLQVSIPQCPDTLYSFVLDNGTTLESCHSYALDLDMKYVHRPVIKQYNVKYRYEGKANKDNVTVTRGTTPLAWGEGDIIRVDENSDFTFRYVSDLKVSVRTEAGQTLNMASGQAHTFNKIQQDITVIIHVDESKPDPDPEPEVKHQITYSYKGEANANNVHVFKNGMTTAWAKTEAIEVNDGANYTFGYTSGMIVTVRTKDGKTLSMSSGSPYTFTNITSDIEIIISAATPEYAVKYIFEGKYTEPNVKVEKEKGSTAFEAWVKNTNVYVTEGDNFTFKANQHTNSGFPIQVSVKVKGQDVPKNPDGSYTLKNIYEDITVVISTNLHQVVYEYTGEANKENVSVHKSSSLTADTKWTEKTEIIYVDHDTDFTFATDSRHELVITENGTGMTAQTTTEGGTKNTFELKNIKEDKKVVIGAKTEEDLLEHKVTYVLLGAADGNTTVKTADNEEWIESDAGVKIVADGAGFSFTAVCPWNLTVTAFETNNPGTAVAVVQNGSSYSLSNIKKNVTVRIRATTHQVSFTYSGSNADVTSVPLVKGTSSSTSSWKPGTDGAVTIDDNGSFTFTNKSKFTITVTQKGTTNSWDIAPNASHSFSKITNDIQLEVKVELYKVIYTFDNPEADNVATWVDVKIGTTAWTAENAGVQYIEKGGSFTFNCTIKTGTNGRIVYVEENNADVSHSGNAYTLENIQSNKEIHIMAVKTYTVQYVFANGTSKPAGFKIEGHGNTVNKDWGVGNTHQIVVDAGTGFTFKMNQDLEVTADKGTTFTLHTEEDKYTYLTTNVQKDIVITLTATKPHVTLIIPNGIECDNSSNYVGSGTNFTFTPAYPAEKPKTKYEFVVTYKKDQQSATQWERLTPVGSDKFTVPNVTEDMIVDIKLQRKPADVTIEATVHDWTELKTVDGGSIFPTTK